MQPRIDRWTATIQRSLFQRLNRDQAIWNRECREYANNNEKAKVCEEVYVIFYENFLGKEGAKKTN
jgi:hypothetical protein